MNEELQTAMYALSSVLMANERREAEAVEGYTEQLRLISEAREKLDGDAAVLEFLDKLEVATKEKIADELNHGESLYAEYVVMTGIQPAKE